MTGLPSRPTWIAQVGLFFVYREGAIILLLRPKGMAIMSLLVRFVLCTLGIFLFGTAATNAASSNDILAEIDGESITTEQVEKAIAPQISKLQEDIYNLKRQKLEAMINDRLLAKEAARQGISVAALLDREVTSKVGLVTE